MLTLGELRCRHHVNEKKAVHSLGTLGGGNHFIELDKDEEDGLYVIIHSGSRTWAGDHRALSEDGTGTIERKRAAGSV